MNHSIEDIQAQLQAREDSHWEFKQVEFAGTRPKRPPRDDWANEIAAFANADGGVMIASVDDDGNVIGMSGEQIKNLDALLVEVSTDSLEPPVRIRTHHKLLPDGQLVLLLEVPESDVVHKSPKGYYLRVGGSKRLMRSDEQLRLMQRRTQRRYLWFDEQPVPNTGFGSLAEELWIQLLSAEGARDPEKALGKLALLGHDHAGELRATVAGVLFCTPDPEQWLPSACITATKYRGSDRTTGQIDAQQITGPLNKQIANAVAFAAKNMHVGARKDPARTDLPQYSLTALFEAIVNAVVHRDYSMRGSRIRLSMFNDRLEIQSPGSLPNNLTIENMASRQATRNEALASVLARMPVEGTLGSDHRVCFMEHRGDGVLMIRRETWELSGKYPEYKVIDDSEVLLIIPAAEHIHSPTRAAITAWSSGQPLPGADLLLLYPDKTWKQVTTNEQGDAEVDLHSTHLPMTVFASAPGHAASIERDWIPSDRALAMDLETLPKGGSVVISEGTGQIPGLTGTLNPVRDALDRTYLYAGRIAIEQGKPQPVHFLLGQDLRLTDSDGVEMHVRIIDVVGRSALVEYVDFSARAESAPHHQEFVPATAALGVRSGAADEQRRDDIIRFYGLLDRLEQEVGGKRRLRDCTGRMDWPQRGIYFFFEDGEARSDTGQEPRVVRVGTHAIAANSRTTLWNRLSQHRGVASTGTGNHRGSVFRKIVGSALARKKKISIPSWGEGNTASVDIRSSEQDHERRVSDVIRAMPFLWLAVDDAPGPSSKRAYIERNAIALLSNFSRSALDPASDGWLGHSSDRERVRKSGLWNQRHVEENYEPEFLNALESLIEGWMP